MISNSPTRPRLPARQEFGGGDTTALAVVVHTGIIRAIIAFQVFTGDFSIKLTVEAFEPILG
ncbi:hypothetical protein CO181_02230 [candidate division WWE3 bacterium CG_4_9_14_3_um_filter_43_9]|uniref:Uncharacterized protein n=1 Tax=candidate division WWE3 bacterium CG_4_9_14_3_um_filter_43_9 TaxID=1975082 RepID=A0A2M7WXI7_UNCKA|nr:MAG: hypothetical protein CO181_02230 [candidate division WWE3 bacterium CG_4_9_14_3_um_filter_43_9]